MKTIKLATLQVGRIGLGAMGMSGVYAAGEDAESIRAATRAGDRRYADHGARGSAQVTNSPESVHSAPQNIGFQPENAGTIPVARSTLCFVRMWRSPGHLPPVHLSRAHHHSPTQGHVRFVCPNSEAVPQGAADSDLSSSGRPQLSIRGSVGHSASAWRRVVVPSWGRGVRG
jgi:hypothetical protein